jgi:DAACS family dicarboxylate/amino acid:cation (Na+ or H+) symporter/aerobic C4-dicarboxylate transport protein
VVDVFKPGAGMNIDVASLDTSSLATYTTAVKHASFMDFVMNIIPDTIVDAFAKGNVLQILLFSILLGVALAHVGPRAKVFGPSTRTARRSTTPSQRSSSPRRPTRR